MRYCPRDNSVLVNQSGSAKRAQSCETCSGLWLPQAVVEKFVGEIKKPEKTEGLAAGQELLCPDDGARLIAVNDRGVEIDICSQCGGVWLDGGELDRLAHTKSWAHRMAVDAGDAALNAVGEASARRVSESVSFDWLDGMSDAALEIALECISGILDGL